MITILESGPGAVKEAIARCGGLVRLDKGQRVLVKPNLCLGGGLPLRLPGLCTNVSVVEEIIELFLDHGVDDIAVGEGTVLIPEIGSSTWSAFESLGYSRLADRYGVELLDFNDGPFVERPLVHGTASIAASIPGFDFLVNVPCLKTHILTKVSLAMKNLKGVLKMSSKQGFHRDGLERHIAELARVVASDLAVIDGRLATELGPDSGIVKRAGLVVAGTDLFEVDVVGTRLLGIRPEEVGHLAYYAKLAGRSFAEPIAIDGIPVESAAVPCRWQVPREAELYSAYGLRGFEIAADAPETVCSMCRVTLHFALEGYAYAHPEADLEGVEIVMGQNIRQFSSCAKSLRIGDCALPSDDGGSAEIRVAGCPPEIDELVDALVKLSAAEERA